MEMKEIKQSIAREKKLFDEVETLVKGLEEKANSISERFTSLTEELEALEASEQQAITDYAGGQLPIEGLNMVVQNVQVLKPQKEAVEKALLVAKANLRTELDRRQERLEALKSEERLFWKMVGEAELSRGIIFIKRALVALECSGKDSGLNDYISKYVADKLYINTNGDEGKRIWREFVDKTKKELTKEY